MENKSLIHLIFAVAGLILCSCAPTVLVIENPALETDTIQEKDLATIQASSVLIVVQSSQSFNDLALGHGIGTLVEIEGEAYLVTHNHWGEVLEDDLATIELRDAKNRLIQPLFASAFKALAVYQDPGTLVLRATPELIARVQPAQIDNAELEANAVVQVATRALPERESITVLVAQVVQPGVYESQPVYEIRCLNGQHLQKGDSGGGVWHEGKLVGNNWAVLLDQAAVDTNAQDNLASPTASSESYTAVLPEVFHQER